MAAAATTTAYTVIHAYERVLIDHSGSTLHTIVLYNLRGDDVQYLLFSFPFFISTGLMREVDPPFSILINVNKHKIDQFDK